MMRFLRVLLLCPAVLALSQCSGWLPPFETVPAEGAGDSAATRVGVCYNRLTASSEQLLAIAAASCGAGSTPKPAGRDVSLTYCPLLTPSRATFICPAP
jgi:hypothetical protein